MPRTEARDAARMLLAFLATPTVREHFTFREHEGRGYWRDNRWIEW